MAANPLRQPSTRRTPEARNKAGFRPKKFASAVLTLVAIGVIAYTIGHAVYNRVDMGARRFETVTYRVGVGENAMDICRKLGSEGDLNWCASGRDRILAGNEYKFRVYAGH